MRGKLNLNFTQRRKEAKAQSTSGDFVSKNPDLALEFELALELELEYRMLDLKIIIPVYNESEIIRLVVEDWVNTLEQFNINYQIRLYNDGSTDETAQVLGRLASQYGDTIKVVHKLNSGHGPTILQAYNESLDAEWIFQVDSDNEISAAQFPAFWEQREQYDFLIGKRRGRKSPLLRRIMTWMSWFVVWEAYGGGVKDVNSPYRLMRVDAFKDVFARIPAKTFAPNIIITGMAIKQNRRRIKVLDVQYNIRKTGTASLGKNIPRLISISVKSFVEVIAFVFR